ncbi:cell wall-binding repeat-containing protein [Sutcliffiella deserti]|uniref:cell wall-binding repeat-containing protein n=1 Tax=Sutcliffiella deserti TaxID=2875501 RepID=UPI001CBBB9E3|nr:cell wall-binding repeat-containing protein [Sutcliffiella deserti]
MSYFKVSMLLLILFFTVPLVSFAEKVLVIDPGHGGKFSGTCGYSGNQTGYCEKSANLDVALKLRELLKNTDITVKMTRDNDKAFASSSADDLKERMKVANSFANGNNDNALFLSIHHNAHPTNTFVKGFETYYYDGINFYEKEYPPDPMQLLLVNESRKFANLVHNETLKRVDMVDRKVRNNQSFFVIRNAQMPAVLVELGFMSNRDEEKMIKSSSFQQKAAEGLAAAAINYFKVFEVFDKDNIKLATFDTRADALNFAKAQTRFVKVFDKDKQNFIYSSEKFQVLDKNSNLIKEFYTQKEAIVFGEKTKNTRVVQDKTGFIVWSDYITVKYEVYEQDKLVGKFVDYEYALSVASSYAKAKITSIGKSELIWTNISGLSIGRAINEERVSGINRYETAIEISKEIYPEGFKEDKVDKVVILATGDKFADALSAGPLASKYGNAPILLTRTEKLEDSVIAEINRLGAQKVILIGGEYAIPTQAEQVLLDKGLEVQRIFGESRYETNIAILEAIGDLNGIFIASGQGFADALASAPIAAKKGWGILLTRKGDLAPEAMPFVANKEVVIVGGTDVVSNNVESALSGSHDVTRLAGVDRLETLAKILWHFADDMGGESILVSTGRNFPDALAAAPLAVHNDGAPLILVGNHRNLNVESFLMAYSNTSRVNSIEIIGGTEAVSDGHITRISNKIK